MLAKLRAAMHCLVCLQSDSDTDRATPSWAFSEGQASQGRQEQAGNEGADHAEAAVADALVSCASCTFKASSALVDGIAAGSGARCPMSHADHAGDDV